MTFLPVLLISNFQIKFSKIKFSNKSFRNFVSSEFNDSFIITSTNKEEIYKIKFLHLIQDQISSHLATIFHLSFPKEFFPTILKTVKVNKNNWKIQVSNCRPISLLSNIDKIFEKLMHSRLIEFLKKNLLQTVWIQKNLSTNHLILTLLESIQKALDDGQFVCGIFIDLKKAMTL